MPSRIDDSVRLNVIWQWIRGGRLEDIADKNQISYGTVRNVIDELRDGRFPEFGDSLEYLDNLRWLSQQLTSRHRTLQQALGGHLLLEELLSIRVDPAELPRLLRVLRKISQSGFPRDAFVKSVLHVTRLEEEMGLDFIEVERKAAGLKSDVSNLEKTKKELESTINAQQSREQEARQSLDRTLKTVREESQRLEQSKTNQLARNKLTEERLTRYLEIHRRLVSYGISFEKLDSLVKILEEFERHWMQPSRIVGYVAKINSLSQQVEEWNSRLGTVQKSLAEGREALEEVNGQIARAKAELVRLGNEKTELLALLAKTREAREQYSLQIDMAQTFVLLLHDPSKATDQQLMDACKVLEGIVKARKSVPHGFLDYDQPREMMRLLVETVLGKTLVFKIDQEREMTELRDMNTKLVLGVVGKLRGDKIEVRKERENLELEKRRFEEATEDKLLEVALAAVKEGAILIGRCKNCGAKVAMIPGPRRHSWLSFSCSSCHSSLAPVRSPLPMLEHRNTKRSR